MVIAGDFKNGITFEYEGNVMQVVEFQHVKPGKGAAFVRTKLKNVISIHVGRNRPLLIPPAVIINPFPLTIEQIIFCLLLSLVQ